MTMWRTAFAVGYVACLASIFSGCSSQSKGSEPVSDVKALHAQLHEMVDKTLAALPVDGLSVAFDEIREAQCNGPADGALGEYEYQGPVPEGANPVAIVEAAQAHWDRVGIPHTPVKQHDRAVMIFATIEHPETGSEFNLGVAVTSGTKLVSVGGSTPCVAGAKAE